MYNECRALDEIYEAKECLKSINKIVGSNMYTKSVENVKAMEALRMHIAERKKEDKNSEVLKTIKLDNYQKVNISKKIEGDGIIQSPGKIERRLYNILKEKANSNAEELTVKEREQFNKLKIKFEAKPKTD